MQYTHVHAPSFQWMRLNLREVFEGRMTCRKTRTVLFFLTSRPFPYHFLSFFSERVLEDVKENFTNKLNETSYLTVKFSA